jgi:glucose/arabinose dehydrogenase/PKD repeat protein
MRAALRGLAVATVVAGALVAGLWSAGAASAGLPPGFQDTTIFTGLTNPTTIVFAPDGRVIVGEKSGLIKVFSSLTATTPTVLADLRTEVYSNWDRGILGLALDPSFPTRPYLYVLYTYDGDIGGPFPKWGTPNTTSDPCPTPPGINTDGCVVSGRLVKLTLSGNTSTSEQVLVNDWCEQFPSHSMGSLVFGADGSLFASAGESANFDVVDYGQFGSPQKNPCGDPPAGVGGTESPPTSEGGRLRAQDLRTMTDPVGLDGSVIRVNPDTGAGMPDNPLAASTDANARRIVAEGFRNPYRMTVRPGTSEVWVGDVGWGQWEEIDRVDSWAAGYKNFGWPCYEGTVREGGIESLGINMCTNLYADPAATTGPYYEYPDRASTVAGDGCPTGSAALAGLAFYTGGSYPASFNGGLFFADYSRKCIWFMARGANGLPNPAAVTLFGSALANPVQLVTAPGGDLFYPDFNGGAIHRISYAGANTPPNAVASASPLSGPTPLTVTFDGSGSNDPDAGDTITYSWDLNADGVADSTAVKPTFTYSAGGTYAAKLTVTDNHGLSSTATVTISAGNSAPTATISAPTATTAWRVGQSIGFSGSATDPEDGTEPPARLSWALILQHCPASCHEHALQTFPGVASGSFTAPDHEYPSYLELRLTATDSAGLTDTKSVRLDPQTVNLTFASSPSGLQVVVGATGGATPFTRTVILGSSNTVSSPTPQTLGGTTYDFASWSDGGASGHTITANAAATYTATFNARAGSPNLIQNPSFEGSTTGWNGYQSTIALAHDGVVGTDAARVAYGGTGTSYSILPATRPVKPTTAGVTYTSSAYVKTAGAGKTFCLKIREWSSAGAVAGSAQKCVTGTASWQQFPQVTYTTLGGSGSLEAYISQTSAPAAGDAFEVDGVTLQSGTTTGGDTTPPETTITSGPPATTTATTAAFAFSASESGSTFACSLDSGAFAPCMSPQSYSGLAPGTHTFQVRATDVAGNVDPTPASQTWTVTAPDTTPPTVAVTAPTAGATVTGTATLSANASDNVAVSKVDFLVNGSVVGTDTTAPYSIAWNSTAVANGPATITARATDSSTNATTSAGVGVTIANGTAGGTNLVTNGSFEGSLTGWGGYQSTLSLANDGAVGANAAKVTGNAGVSSFSIYPPKRTVASTTAGRVYTGGAYVRSDTPGRTVCLRIREWNASTLVAAKAVCRTTTAAWSQFAPLPYTATASANQIDIYVSASNPIAGDSFEVDGISLVGS